MILIFVVKCDGKECADPVRNYVEEGVLFRYIYKRKDKGRERNGKENEIEKENEKNLIIKLPRAFICIKILTRS